MVPLERFRLLMFVIINGVKWLSREKSISQRKEQYLILLRYWMVWFCINDLNSNYMSKVRFSNFDTLEVASFNCFFSEIREVSQSSLHEREIAAADLNNCFVTHENNEILVLSRGGTRFQLPMDQQVSAVFPLPEGILIEFFIKPQVKLQEILYLQRTRGNMDLEDSQEERSPRYCYATLTRHPYNPLKVLGELGTHQQINPWLRSQERILWVTNQVPIAVSYNEQLGRSAFYALLANTEAVAREYQFAFVPTQTYSLKSLADCPHYQLLAQAVFEESSQGDRISSVVLNRSVKRGHFLIYASTHKEIRVYQVDLYATNNATKLLTKIANAHGIIEACLYTEQAFYLQGYRHHDTQLEGQLLNQILREQLATLPDCVAILQDNFIGYYKNGFLVATESLNRYQMPIRCHGSTFIDAKDQTIPLPPLIANSFDSLVLKTLQLVLEDEHTIIKCLSYYTSSRSLGDSLFKICEGRSNVLFILHLLYQQIKLYELMREQRAQLARIMLDISVRLNRREYVDYYLREGYGSNVNLTPPNQNFSPDEVYDIFAVLNKLLVNPQSIKNLYSIYNRSKFLLNFYQYLIWGQTQLPIIILAHSKLAPRYNHGKEYFYRTRFPLLSQQVFHLEYYTQLYNQELINGGKTDNKSQRAFIYLIKNHTRQSQILTYPLAIRATFNWLLRQMRRELPYSLYQTIPKLGFDLIHREDLYKNIELYRKKTISVPYHLQKPSLDDHIKTLVHTSNSQEYFLTSNASQMNKINNDLIFEEVDRLLNSTSEIKIKIKDIESIPEDRWQIQSQNILIKFANRRLAIIIGQGAFNLGISRSFITDIIKINKINLSAIMPNDIKITLDLKDDKEAIIHWPQFHAGMAAGLKLSRHVIPLSEDHLKTWIFYQKPDTPKRDHSGFLLSLGLLGYLKCFSPTDIYQYLKPNNQFTSVAILLGVSASNISKSDEALSKALVLHIPALLPPTIDVQIPINVQTSALLGIGLLHKGTCNRTMTEMTLSQIGKRPSSDKCIQRQGYSLAAGWALGMICLGMRDKKESFRDLQLEQRLIRFIEGGKVIEPPQSMISTNYTNQSKCSSIKEGPTVNLHVTAPSALLAISLMYLKSNDSELASRITIPNSFNTIQQCNPNHILLKTVAKNLMMWDAMTPSTQFVLGQIPQLIRFIYQNPLNKVYQRYYLVYNVSEIDYQTITTIYLSVITGAIIALSLRYAGTGSQAVVRIIRNHIQHLKGVKITKCQFANDPLNKNSIDQYELFSLLSSSILSLAIVMAGSCDIQSLKLVRVIRKKFQDSKVFHYGFSMAINMSIGFIFLGYGNYTFNREDMSIAALLIATFPQFPNAPGDNRWHLQALRHFYVLAMEEKIFHSVDVDANKVVNVAARMTFFAQGEYQSQDLHTPVLLQQSKRLTHIKIIDEDYYDVNFSFQDGKHDPKVIYIKRKHFKDINPKLLNPENVLTTQLTQQNLKNNLKEQPRFTAFLNNNKKASLPSSLGYLLPNLSEGKSKAIEQRINNTKNQNQLYFQLLKEDRLEMLEIYLTLRREMREIETNLNQDSLAATNISFLLSFEKWIGCRDFLSLITPSLTSIKKLLTQKSSQQQELTAYLNEPHSVKLSKNRLYKFLRILQPPTSRELVIAKNALKSLKARGESEQAMEMLLLLTYPECSQQLLKLILQLYRR